MTGSGKGRPKITRRMGVNRWYVDRKKLGFIRRDYIQLLYHEKDTGKQPMSFF